MSVYTPIYIFIYMRDFGNEILGPGLLNSLPIVRFFIYLFIHLPTYGLPPPPLASRVALGATFGTASSSAAPRPLPARARSTLGWCGLVLVAGGGRVVE